MQANYDYTISQTFSDWTRHRIRLPGFYNSVAAKYLYDRSPEEFDVEQVGMDEQGQMVYVLFWRTHQYQA